MFRVNHPASVANGRDFCYSRVTITAFVLGRMFAALLPM